ncbi:hypothetical protein [Streptomyces anandii]|uniref:hypothetical protein n=1 Tax=Streptomyces anandii TaxID=285454 RepID=UPI00167B57E7|nr:hypothetical protein [Streptomyces anandii]GGX92412.1 hypothetical protein GCM10010510_41890 [Streptomyces anandii JCM 4720]
MKLRVGRVGAGATALAAAATLMVSAGSASATTDPGTTWDHTYEASGVRVYVKEYGDVVSVCDTKANGHSAVVQVRDLDWPYNYEMTAGGGVGSCKSHRASDGAKYNLREGRGIDLYFDGDGGVLSGEGYFVNDH